MNYVFRAASDLFKYFATYEQKEATQAFGQGDLGTFGWSELSLVALIILVCMILVAPKLRDLNIMTAGDETAKSLGIDAGNLRMFVMMVASFLVASVVAFVGPIGFVGLVGPHMSRMIIGSDHRFQLPASGLLGAIILVSSDILGMNIIPPIIIPVGIMTSILGVPFFFYLIMTRRRSTGKMMIKLAINGLTFSYNSVPILDDICMEVAPAKLLSVVGPNGTGKSTLLKCVDRVLKPQQGNILLDRKDIMKMDRMEIAKQVGYVQQNVKRSFPTTVFDTVIMGRRPHQGWQTRDEDHEIVWEILELLDIDQFALKYFNELSGGQQQRVLIARALAQEASVLLLDEPTSNLDIKRQLEVMDIIQDLVRTKRITAMVAIHDLNLASRYSDRMIMMKNGRIIVAGDPRDVLTAENIEAIYGVEVDIRTQSDAPYVVPLKPIKTKKVWHHENDFIARSKKKVSSIGRISDNLSERFGQVKVLK